MESDLGQTAKQVKSELGEGFDVTHLRDSHGGTNCWLRMQGLSLG